MVQICKIKFFLKKMHFFCEKICQFRKKQYLCTRKRKTNGCNIKKRCVSSVG